MNKIKRWDLTRKLFIEWLSDNKLKKEFSNNIHFEDLSLWWLTNLYEKDNVNSSLWYQNLNKVFYEKKFYPKKNFSFFLSFLKLIKRFLSSIFFNLFIKYFYSEKKPLRGHPANCIYVLFSNFTNYKNYYIDRQYGLYGLNNKKNFSYFVDLNENFDLIKNYVSNKKKLSKIPFNYYLSAKNISIFDILNIYLFCLKSLFKIFFILQKKNYFYIKKKNCSNILKELIINSFFGSIQVQLIKGISLKNCLNKKRYKYFINCFDFHPQSRCIYHFANKSNVKKTVNINHVSYSKNNLFMNFKKNEFSKNNLVCKKFSPYPDIYFCRGEKYFKILKSILKNKSKVFIIGSLKIELNKSSINFKKDFKKKKDRNVLLLLCGLSDYYSFIKILNNCNLEKFEIIVAPHPLKKKKTIEDFKIQFNKKFMVDENINKTKIINSCDYIIFGDTSLGLELSIMNKNIFRVYDPDFIPTFDIDNEIKTATNPKSVQILLNQKKIKQKNILIERNYFHKYDKKASQRLTSILNKF